MFESIWTGQSILSACTDIYQLHFIRWNKEEEWTPWNTLLLTLDEAESHLKLRLSEQDGDVERGAESAEISWNQNLVGILIDWRLIKCWYFACL